MSRRKKNHGAIDIDFTLRRVFGKRSFRPLQRDVINAAIEGHDIFLQAATSFGKSLCFQLPAVISHGITVVVSPLLALMNNQVAALQTAGIAVATINSSTPLSERKSIEADLLCGHPRTRFLYVTPELCLTDAFRKTLIRIHQQGQLERVAVDEAHCISEWGHDFRPAYKELSWLKRTLILPSVPIMAVTATATPRVQADIITLLGLDTDTLSLYAMSTARPNIHYEIRYTNDQVDAFPSLLSWLQESQNRRQQRLVAAARTNENDGDTNIDPTAPISGIVYTRLRSSTETLAARLRDHGIGAAPYHAGLNNALRAETQANWLENRPGYAIIVATTAFGMGIDKDDVRFVVHWDLPKSFEGFYQEAGRAGRDGKAALSIIYYSREERDRCLYRVANDGTGIGNDTNATATVNPYNNTNTNTNTNTNYNGVGHSSSSFSNNKKEQRLASFEAFSSFCESTTRCRHVLIKEYFAGKTASATTSAPLPPAQNTQAAEPKCDFACDYCKVGSRVMRERKERGLATEEDAEFVASQWANQAEIEAAKWDD